LGIKLALILLACYSYFISQTGKGKGKRMRTLTIKSDQLFSDYSITYDPEEFSDSEALHLALVDIDPGENYTVQFKNEKEN
jgi:hypothetical protein